MPWQADFVLLASIWGASFLFTRWGAGEFGPVATAAVRVAIAAAFLLPLSLASGHLGALRRHWKGLTLLGLVSAAIPFTCFAFAVGSITTGLSAIMNGTVPLFGALVAFVWMNERLDGSRIAGLALGFAGVAWIAWRPAAVTGHDATNVALAIACCLLATFCYALAAAGTRRYFGALSPLAIAAGSQLGAAVVMAPLAAWRWPAAAPGAGAWVSLALLGVLCTGIAYVLHFRLLQSAGPARALTVTFVVPLFAAVYGALLLGERIDAHTALGAALVMCGTMLGARAGHANSNNHSWSDQAKCLR